MTIKELYHKLFLHTIDDADVVSDHGQDCTNVYHLPTILDIEWDESRNQLILHLECA